VDSETRRHSDEVFKYIIEISCEKHGYKAVRADHIEKSGIITTQIIQNLLESDLVIADLSERNPNVFYELAVRHASRKPFIQIIKSGETIPFDVAANRTVQYDLSLPGASEAVRQIEAQMAAFLAGQVDVENPIANSVDLGKLRLSSDGSERAMAHVIESINSIGAAISRLEQARDPTEKFERARESSIRYKTLFDQANEQIRNLQLIKSKVDFMSIRDESDLYDVTTTLVGILDHIKSKCVPLFSSSANTKAAIEDSIDRVTDILSDMQGNLIPF
jgi:archaellum component FlaC